MKKTSVYLSAEDRDRLNRLAAREGKSQAMVLREALAFYDAQKPDRDFAVLKMEVDPTFPGIPHFDDPQQLQDWIDSEGMKGFGEDSFGDPATR